MAGYLTSGIVDVHGYLASAVARYRNTWLAAGVSLDDPQSLVRLATGELIAVAADFARVSASLGSVRDPIIGDVGGGLSPREPDSDPMLPLNILNNYVLNGAPGVILLGRGRPGHSDAGDRPISLNGPLTLFPGQSLSGVGCAGGRDGAGSVLEWARGAQPAIRIESSAAGYPRPGAPSGHVRISGLSLRTTDAANAGSTAISVDGVDGVVIEDVDITGFQIGIRIQHANRCSVHASRIQAHQRGIVFAVSASFCHVVGCHLTVDPQPRFGGAALAAEVSGQACSLIRCRLDSTQAGGGGGDATLVRIDGSRNLMMGCGVVAPSTGAAAVQVAPRVENHHTVTPVGNAFELNHHRTSVVGQPWGGLAWRPAATYLDDGGYMTAWRDVAFSGFPTIPLSTYNFVLNGSFELVHQVTHPGTVIFIPGGPLEAVNPGDPSSQKRPGEAPPVDQPRPLPGLPDDVTGHIADVPRQSWPRQATVTEPLGWSPSAVGTRPDETFGANRKAFRDDWSVWEAGHLGTLAPRAYWDFAQAPTRDTFRASVDGGGAGDPRSEFDALSDVHHGRQSLWTGVGPSGLRAGSFVEMRLRQELRLPAVAREYVLSGYVKAVGPGAAVLRMIDPDRSVESEPHDGSGAWLQRTVIYRPSPRLLTGGPIPVAIECSLTSAPGEFTEACFDEIQLVAGSYVPHFAERAAADNDLVPGSLHTTIGRSVDLRLIATRLVDHIGEPGETLAMTVVGNPVVLSEDLLIAVVGSHVKPEAMAHLVVDLRRNYEPVFEWGKPASVSVAVLPGRSSVARIDLKAVRAASRILRPGDLLTLHRAGAAPVDELHVVLTGVQREFGE